MDDESFSNRQFRILQALWYSTPITLIIYVFMIRKNIEGRSIDSGDAGSSLKLKILILVFSVVLLRAVPFLEGFIRQIRYQSGKAQGKERSLRTVVGELFQSKVLAMVLCFIPAILGFLLAHQSAYMSDYLLMAAVSVFGLIVYVPKKEKWDEYLKNQDVLKNVA